jgi:hypothetical protein
MARAIHKLTARAAETISNPGRHSDGGGLYLSISAEVAGAGFSSSLGAVGFARRA